MIDKVYFITHFKDGICYFLHEIDYAKKQIFWDVNKPYFFTDKEFCQHVFDTCNIVLPECDIFLCDSYSQLIACFNLNLMEVTKHGRKYRCSSGLS